MAHKIPAHTALGLSIVLSLLAGHASAAPKVLTVDDLRTMQSKMKGFDSLTVDFDQTMFSAARQRNSVRHGKAQFIKPNLFNWMLEVPVREYRLYDGHFFYDYLPDAKTATKFATSGPQSDELKQIIDLVLNFDSLLKRYELVKAYSEGDLITIMLKPKVESNMIELELHFAQKEQFISFLKMSMKGGNTLTHTFKNPSHAAISVSAFAVPTGVKMNPNL